MTGAELRRLRKAAGYTQATLAARLGMTKNHLAVLERGGGAVRAVVALAVTHVCRCAAPPTGKETPPHERIDRTHRRRH